MPATDPRPDATATPTPAAVGTRRCLLASVATALVLLFAAALLGAFARPAGAAEVVGPRGPVVQYSYRDGHGLVFLDTTTYEQLVVGDDQVGGAVLFLAEGTQVVLLRQDDGTLTIELPATVQLRVAEIAPLGRWQPDLGVRAAQLETGLAVEVPTSIRPGDRVTIDTRDGHLVV